MGTRGPPLLPRAPLPGGSTTWGIRAPPHRSEASQAARARASVSVIAIFGMWAVGFWAGVAREAEGQQDQHPRYSQEGEEVSPLHFGSGVGVAGPDRPYRASIAARISRRGFPCRFIAITSRVMLRQRVQVTPWLVYVIVPSRLKLSM